MTKESGRKMVEARLERERLTGLRRCCACKVNKPLTEFNLNQFYCKICKRSYLRAWYKRQPNDKKNQYRWSEDKPGQNARRRKRVFDLKQEMISAYGGCCACCNESEIRFLTLEHVNGGGNEHRRKFSKASRTWLDLKRRGWPEGHIILCWNCQMAKTHYKVCPHKEVKHVAA